jgi:hypothetical protein
MGQDDVARSAVQRMPGVRRVSFAGFSKAIMYVYTYPDRP